MSQRSTSSPLIYSQPMDPPSGQKAIRPSSHWTKQELICSRHCQVRRKCTSTGKSEVKVLHHRMDETSAAYYKNLITLMKRISAKSALLNSRMDHTSYPYGVSRIRNGDEGFRPGFAGRRHTIDGLRMPDSRGGS